ncbi:hypothetical protein A2U01_0059102, partial [Trifolium medium]|nr:hypothetical protein [Trifolium medium]
MSYGMFQFEGEVSEDKFQFEKEVSKVNSKAKVRLRAKTKG